MSYIDFFNAPQKNPIRGKLTFSDAELAKAIGSARFDINNRIPSYREFDGARRRMVCNRENNLTLNDTYRHLNDAGLRKSYTTYIVERFNRGSQIPDRLWKHLEWDAKEAICATSRGLRLELTPDSPTAMIFDAPMVKSLSMPSASS